MIGINPIFIFIVRWVYASISQSHNKNSLAKASILAQTLPMLTELELRAVAGINRVLYASLLRYPRDGYRRSNPLPAASATERR